MAAEALSPDGGDRVYEQVERGNEEAGSNSRHEDGERSTVNRERRPDIAERQLRQRSARRRQYTSGTLFRFSIGGRW